MARDVTRSGGGKQMPFRLQAPRHPCLPASGGDVMAYSNILVGAGVRPAQPVIRNISVADLRDVLAKGVDDFYAMPTHAMFLCIIYPIVGFVLARLTFGYSILPLLYPLASGF